MCCKGRLGSCLRQCHCRRQLRSKDSPAGCLTNRLNQPSLLRVDLGAGLCLRCAPDPLRRLGGNKGVSKYATGVDDGLHRRLALPGAHHLRYLRQRSPMSSTPPSGGLGALTYSAGVLMQTY